MGDSTHHKKLYGTATVGTKGQIVIPSDAREEFGVESGERLYVVGIAHKGALLLIKEEQMSQFIEHIADTAASVKAKFEELKKE